jgi:hypothetical protein
VTAPTLNHDVAVERGVELLDAKLGRDVWLPRIDIRRLDVGSLNRCVACQATDRHWYGEAFRELFPGAVVSDDVDEFEGSPSRSEHYGFGILVRPSVDAGDFSRLTLAWVRKIEQLRGEVTA